MPYCRACEKNVKGKVHRFGNKVVHIDVCDDCVRKYRKMNREHNVRRREDMELVSRIKRNLNVDMNEERGNHYTKYTEK